VVREHHGRGNGHGDADPGDSPSHIRRKKGLVCVFFPFLLLRVLLTWSSLSLKWRREGGVYKRDGKGIKIVNIGGQPCATVKHSLEGDLGVYKSEKRVSY